MALTLEELRGHLADLNKLLVFSPQGDPVFIGTDKKDEALQKGYREATPEEKQNELDHKEYGEGLAAQTAAGAAGVLRGVSFGLSDPLLAYGGQKLAEGVGAMTGQPIRQDITAGGVLEQLKKQNEGISTGTEIAGAVLPAVLTAGASAPESAAALGAGGLKASLASAARLTPAGIATRIGGVAEHAAEWSAEKILSLASEGALSKAATKIVGAGAGAATEGALFGAGKYASKLALEEEPEFAAEGLIHEIGHGALIGGATGGIFGSARELIPVGVKYGWSKLLNAVDNGAKSPSSGIVDRAKNWYTKYSSARSGIHEDDIHALFEPVMFNPQSVKDLTPDILEPFFKADSSGPSIFKYSNAEEFIKDINDRDGSALLANTLDTSNYNAEKILNSSEKLTTAQKDKLYNSVYKTYKNLVEGGIEEGKVNTSLNYLNREYDRVVMSKDIQQVLNKADPQVVMNAADGLNKKLDMAARNLAENPDRYLAKEAINDFKSFVYNYDKRLTQLKNGVTDAPTLYGFIKDERSILDNMLKFGKELPPNQVATMNALKGVRHDIKDLLIDPTIWGEGIAKVGEFNVVLSEYLSSLQNFKRYFGTKIIDPKGNINYIVNPKSIKNFFTNPDAVQNNVRREVIKEFNDNAKNLLNTIVKGTTIDTIEPMLGAEAKKSLSRFLIGTDTNNFLVELLEKDRLFTDVKRQTEKAGIYDMLPLGAWLHGVGAGAAGSLVHAILRSGKDPAFEIRAMKKIANVLELVPHHMINAVDNMAKVTDKVIESGALPPLILRAEEHRKTTKQPNFGEYAKQAQALQANPEILQNNLNSSLSEIEAISPTIAGVMREKLVKSMQFLASKIPKSYSPDPLRPNFVIQPSRFEQAKFERYVRAVDKPLSVFDDMAAGVINPEGVEVLKELYPAIYQKFYEISLKQIAAGNVSRNTRLKLQAALGLSEGDVARKQSIYESEGKEPGEGNQGRKLGQSDIERITESETH